MHGCIIFQFSLENNISNDIAADLVEESPAVAWDPKDHVTRYHATYHAAPSHYRAAKKEFSR